MGQETFPSTRQVGPIRPQQTSVLEDSSVIINPKILAEAPVLEPSIDDLDLLSFPVFPCYYGKMEENVICAPESFRFLPSTLKSLLIDLRLPVAMFSVPT